MAAQLINHESSSKPIGINGHGLKKPFLIGVAGGTASGKVCLHYILILNLIYCLS